MLQIQYILDLANKVGAIEKVKNLLLSQPDKAAENLAESLDELYKMFQSLDDEIVRYLSLSFDTAATVPQDRAALLGIEVGQSKIRMHAARGHCAKIKNIYDKQLNGWFDRVFSDPNDRQNVRTIFDNMGTADDAAIKAVDNITAWLTQEAGDTLDFLDGGNRFEADQRVKRARSEIKPARIMLTEAMSQLRAMQADFITASKIV